MPESNAGFRFLSVENVSAPARGLAWHYSNADGLLGILKSRSIWASAPQVLNDSSEVRYGMRVYERAWRHMRDDFTEPQIRFVDMVLNGWVADLQEHSFVVSASREPDLLTQWLNYSHADGFAIGFQLDEEWRTRPTIHKDGTLGFTHSSKVLQGWWEVSYDKAEHRTRAESYLRAIASQTPASEEIWPHSKGFFRSISPNGLLLLKHPAFEDEREVRFVGSSEPSNIDFRTSGGSVVPYAEVAVWVDPGDPGRVAPEALRLPLMKVICGPGCRPGTKKKVKRMLARYKFTNVTVGRSKIPPLAWRA